MRDGRIFVTVHTPMTPGTADPWGPLRDIRLGRAKDSLESGNPAEAIEWLERAPRTPERRAVEAEARYRLASELIMKRRFADAETELRQIPYDSSINRCLTEERVRLLRIRGETTSDLREMAGGGISTQSQRALTRRPECRLHGHCRQPALPLLSKEPMRLRPTAPAGISNGPIP